VNYWGVSFADDDNTFYATRATGGERYLVRGNFKATSIETLATDVECPSISPISPDGTRLAFKQAIDNDPRKGWRISVLELDAMKVTNLRETRSIDDLARIARLIGIVALCGISKGFPGGVGEDSFGVGEVRGQGVGFRCGGTPGGFDGGPNELFGGPEP